jgi:hypothetical protein
MTTLQISRRTVLKGLGTAIALPLLEAMGPLYTLAGPVPKKTPPRRLAFLYVPNGKNMDHWTPKFLDDKFELPYVLEPLKPVKEHLLVLSGLTLDKARPNGDGAGDHARAMASFLTGRQAKKTHGADIRIGISVDQLAAQKIGKHTKFPSLELGCEGGLNSGNCDSGYSCAYSANISWRSESTPNAKEINPRQVFDRLFANQVKSDVDKNRAKRDRYHKSILDFVAEDANQLKQKLGRTDQRKLDEYLSSVREIETRIARAEEVIVDGSMKLAKPAGIPKEYRDHLRLMADLLVLAFQADLTRIGTFVFANDGSNRSYRFMGVPEGHHELSHHGNDRRKLDKIRQINRFHVAQLAYLLEKLKAVKEGGGNLLDNCMVVYGSGIGDGNRHNHDDLPILLAGKGGGSLKTGRHIRYKKETPLTNLYLGLLDRMGAPAESFGDSTGRLESLS